MSPGDIALQLTTNTLSEACKGAFGSIAAPVVDGELLDLFGIGGGNSLQTFMSQIEAALQKIESQLTALQKAVDTIVAGIEVIEEKIDDTDVQQALDQFVPNANQIKSFFATYSGAMTLVASGDVTSRTAGLTEIYNLLSTESAAGLQNAVALATALTNVQDAFVPAMSEKNGLVAYQTIVVTDAIRSAALAASANQWVGTDSNEGFRAPDGSVGVYRGITVYQAVLAAAKDALEGPVTDTLKAFLTSAIQGLMLLNVAYRKTDPVQLGSQAQGVANVLDAIVAFGSKIASAIDDEIARQLQAHTMPAVGQDGTLWSTDNANNWDTNNPLGSDWAQWDKQAATNPDDTRPRSVVVLAPWAYADNARTASTYDNLVSVFAGIYPDNYEVMVVDFDTPTPTPHRYDQQASNSNFFQMIAGLRPPIIDTATVKTVFNPQA